jgi:hypothetical protein
MKLDIADRVVSNSLTMVIVSEDQYYYHGYHEYKGKSVGVCSLIKTMLTNPHYSKNITIEKA